MPFKFVDHTHSDAIMDVTNRPNGKDLCKKIFGNKVSIVPYVMPGFGLAQKINEVYKKNPNINCLILLNHGIFTFDNDAKTALSKVDCVQDGFMGLDIGEKTIEKYLEIYKMLKKINNDVEFSSDFIIGYPGEMDSDFNDTMELVKNIKFINSYSFIFSPRPGTPASKLKPVDKEIAKERLLNIQRVLEKHQIRKNESLINTSIEVLVENKLKDQKKYFGRNFFLNSVIFDAKEKHIGKLVYVKISQANRNTLFGKIDENKNMRAA